MCAEFAVFLKIFLRCELFLRFPRNFRKCRPRERQHNITVEITTLNGGEICKQPLFTYLQNLPSDETAVCIGSRERQQLSLFPFNRPIFPALFQACLGPKKRNFGSCWNGQKWDARSAIQSKHWRIQGLTKCDLNAYKWCTYDTLSAGS